MLTRKCDICGAEMRITTPRYKVTFDGWLYTQEKDICIDCFKRVTDEIRQADTPQTGYPCETCANNGDHDGKCRNCVVDSEPIRLKTPSNYEPKQTDCPWK